MYVFLGPSQLPVTCCSSDGYCNIDETSSGSVNTSTVRWNRLICRPISPCPSHANTPSIWHDRALPVWARRSKTGAVRCFNPSASGSGTRKKLSRYNHVLRKLEFYIAHVLATPIGIMENVSDAALSWSRWVQAEYSNTNIVCQSMIINTIVLAGTIRKSTIEAFFSQIAATSSC